MSYMFSLLLTIGEANQRIGVKYEEERPPLREEILFSISVSFDRIRHSGHQQYAFDTSESARHL